MRHLADGVVLAPPTGPGSVRIRERRPLGPASDIIEQIRAELAEFAPLEVSPVELMTTYEGEYAALFTITGRRGELHLQRAVGVIWGDFHQSRIDGRCDRPERFAAIGRAVRDLTYYHSLGLGELRRRRFVYTPPPGWHGYGRGLVTLWHPPGFPADDSLIRVFPACAGGDNAARELDRQLHEMSWFGFRRESAAEPTAISSRDGLDGHLFAVVGRLGNGPRRHFELALLRDRRFHYVMRLESGVERGDARRLFAEMVRSIRQLPAPVSTADSDTFAYWAT